MSGLGPFAGGQGPVDLRSDTVTKPTANMRDAMATAPVGDDVYGEDPEVNELEAEVAALFGHEAALFVPSGTMGNQIALTLLVRPGEELVCDSDAHIVTYEQGAAAALFGISTRTVPSVRGLVDPVAYAEQIRGDDWHVVTTRALAVENTHNRGGGTVQPLETLQRLRAVADTTGIAVHCDGARIWNAHVAAGVPLATYGRLFDTLSVCLSKGLGAPVGSVLVGGAERIARARVVRKRLGGGMRQAGVLAAAGRYALRHHLDRLADDHKRAQALREALVPFGVTTADGPEITNIVLLDLTEARLDAVELSAAARERGVLFSPTGRRRARLVTHLDIDDRGLEHAVDVLTDLLRG
jgi:threonine aldolase